MKDFTTGKESYLILKFALPMVLGNFFQNLYGIVDSIVVGKFLGKEALAAVGASFPIIFMLISLVIGVGSGASVIISQYFGAKKNREVVQAVDTVFIFFFIASILVAAVGILFAEPAFRLLQLPEEIIPDAKLYLNIYLLGMIVFFGFNGIASVLRGVGDSKTPLYFMIIATLTNIALDLLFVVVFKWGIASVAVATIIAHGIAFALAVAWLNRSHPLVRLSPVRFRFNSKIFHECIRIGLPIGLQQSFVSISMVAIMGIVNGFGTNVIAVYTVALRLDAFAKMPSMNFASALSSFVGQNLGAGNEKRAKKGFISTMLMSVIYSASISLIIIIFGKPLMSLFTNDKDIISGGYDYLIIVGSFYILFSAMFTVSGMLRGAGDTFIPMLITIVALWVIRVPLSWLLSQSELQEQGIWWAVPISWAFGFFASYFYFRTGIWKKKRVVNVSGEGTSVLPI